MKTKHQLPPAYFKCSVAHAMRNPISIEHLETVLLMVDSKVPRELMCRWSEKERAIAEDWAIRVHLSASDNPIRVPRKPAFVIKAEKLFDKFPQGPRSLACEAFLAKNKGTLYELLQ